MKLSDLSYIWKTNHKKLQLYAKSIHKPLNDILTFWDRLEFLRKNADRIDFPQHILQFYDILVKKVETMSAEDIPLKFFKQKNPNLEDFIRQLLPEVEQRLNVKLSTLVGQVNFYYGRGMQQNKTEETSKNKSFTSSTNEEKEVDNTDTPDTNDGKPPENKASDTLERENVSLSKDSIAREKSEENGNVPPLTGKEDKITDNVDETLKDKGSMPSKTGENNVGTPPAETGKSSENKGLGPQKLEAFKYYVFQPEPTGKEDGGMLEKEMLNQENNERAEEDKVESPAFVKHEQEQKTEENKDEIKMEEETNESEKSKVNWMMIAIIGGIAIIALIFLFKFMKKKSQQSPISYIPPASQPQQISQTPQTQTVSETPSTMGEYTKSIVEKMKNNKTTRRPEEIWGRRS